MYLWLDLEPPSSLENSAAYETLHWGLFFLDTVETLSWCHQALVIAVKESVVSLFLLCRPFISSVQLALALAFESSNFIIFIDLQLIIVPELEGLCPSSNLENSQ